MKFLIFLMILISFFLLFYFYQYNKNIFEGNQNISLNICPGKEDNEDFLDNLYPRLVRNVKITNVDKEKPQHIFPPKSTQNNVRTYYSELLKYN